jgi:hypothetical protein
MAPTVMPDALVAPSRQEEHLIPGSRKFFRVFREFTELRSERTFSMLFEMARTPGRAV